MWTSLLHRSFNLRRVGAGAPGKAEVPQLQEQFEGAGKFVVHVAVNSIFLMVAMADQEKPEARSTIKALMDMDKRCDAYGWQRKNSPCSGAQGQHRAKPRGSARASFRTDRHEFTAEKAVLTNGSNVDSVPLDGVGDASALA